MINEPLGLPQGSVRAILVILLVVALIVLVYLGKNTAALEGMAAAAFGWYFGSRASEVKTQPRSESEILMKTQTIEEADEPVEIVAGE